MQKPQLPPLQRSQQPPQHRPTEEPWSPIEKPSKPSAFEVSAHSDMIAVITLTMMAKCNDCFNELAKNKENLAWTDRILPGLYNYGANNVLENYFIQWYTT